MMIFEGNLPGSLGYEEIDVQMLIDWEIDYFKARFSFKSSFLYSLFHSSMTIVIPERMGALTPELASTLIWPSRKSFQCQILLLNSGLSSIFQVCGNHPQRSRDTRPWQTLWHL